MSLNEILAVPLSVQQLFEQATQRWKLQMEQRMGGLQAKADYLWKEHPGYAEQLVDQANDTLNGRLVLSGTMKKRFFVGNPPLWHENPVGDPQYEAELNRKYHWKHLIYGYSLTGKSVFLDKILQEWQDWVEQCPREEILLEDCSRLYERYDGVGPWSVLNCGIRMFEVYPLCLHALLDADSLSPQFVAMLYHSAYEQGQFLSSVSPLLWPSGDHNHLLMEMLGLLTLCTLFPELKDAEAWKELACLQLERCAEKQITEDGGHIEGCPGYHNGSMHWFSLAYKTSQEAGRPLSSSYEQQILQALDYSIHSSRPTGTNVPWGDSDAVPSPVRAAVFGYAAFGHTDLLHRLRRFMNQQEISEASLPYLWQIRGLETLFSSLKEMQATDQGDLPLMNWQRELSQVMMRSNWSREGLSLFFACRTPVQNGHAHIDPGGFDFTAYGKPLIVDPGRYCYREGEDRRKFKSAAWHNTLTINHQEPFEYVSNWEFTPQKPGRVTWVWQEATFLAAEALHANYEPVIHKRLLILMEGRFVIVLDELNHIEPDSSVQMYYHLNAQQTYWDAFRRCAITLDEGTAVHIYPSQGLQASFLSGQISDVIDKLRPSTRVKLESDRVDGKGTCRYGTLIVPLRAGEQPPQVSWVTLGAGQMGDEVVFYVGEELYLFRWNKEGLKRV
ncbi:alginate lyase family protein [Paenibacillus roseipurpureus]|uniref:Alginate lyase family protein n=1 Tax=Paenibacillus roseopurpureus TaxID=2918901 RepID=A0AA96LKS3_9BACL|nr:alginate lyase family protein [Paenibacillus sp. MBLB1832]WNR42912.1 alginate lyase family protein [Paenibacillus sp. MBLB1832]